ncbi:hypothetical protein NCCP2495_11810 [Dietzia sp. NCCP-2495]|uniref:hypothetical protein n=1 Tax=Dietzia sp. NCCP-2495 TaxID=2934675 RepID=UPI00280E421F|nr:hypothetical protein NCCP2495_11810 [Dietzia sp. NCCP-2495]
MARSGPDPEVAPGLGDELGYGRGTVERDPGLVGPERLEYPELRSDQRRCSRATALSRRSHSALSFSPSPVPPRILAIDAAL